jgi:rRNA N6-adenosine-methyltransferase METTL5
MQKLKQKHIEHFLQDMEDFEFGEKEKIMLEQHMTPPLMAAQLLFHIYQREAIESMVVADLGAGTGMLAAGLVFIGALHTIAVEIDEKYVAVGQKQLEDKVEGGSFEFINADVTSLKLRGQQVDMVVMNPPFGTKEEGIDVKFLELAMSICQGPIYSMHKSSTRAYLQKMSEQHGYQFELVMQVDFPLKKRFKGYHKKDLAFTQVDMIRLVPVKGAKMEEVKP